MEKYVSKLRDFIANTQICCLSSINLEGYPQTRAMLMPIKIENNYVWLHTNTSSNKIKQFKNNNKASIYFFNQENYEGLSIEGTVKILEKEEDKKAFWKDEYHMYYSNGIGLEDFCVVKMQLRAGEYYSNFKVETFKI